MYSTVSEMTLLVNDRQVRAPHIVDGHNRLTPALCHCDAALIVSRAQRYADT
jgi:hypothetical protein